MIRPNIFMRINRGEIARQLPLLELAGDNRVLVENHSGVLEYSTNKIQIKVTYGKLTVIGNKLKILQMSKEQLVINGRIDEICLFRR